MSIRSLDFAGLVAMLPEDRRTEVIRLAGKGDGLLIGSGFGGGLVYGFWEDCVKGEIIRYLVRTGKAEPVGYVNCISDFYIDSRCGRAPRKDIEALQSELKLAINDDFHPCAICGKPTDKTVDQQHANRTSEYSNRDEWKLSEKRMKNRGVKGDSPCCWSCYQDKLTTQRRS